MIRKERENNNLRSTASERESALDSLLLAQRRFILQPETIEITGLPLGTKTALEEIGRSRGKSVEDYLRDLVQTDILSERPFSEILEPIRRSFDESGMSEEELDALFEEARINHLSYQERLWLIERLARRLREDAASRSPCAIGKATSL